MSTVQSALDLLLQHTSTPEVEQVSLFAAEGRVLAAPLFASRAVPAWPRAAMDGYAVNASDLFGASFERPVELSLGGSAAPGRPFRGEIQGRHTVRISTGAPMPPGTNAVVKWEETRAGSHSRIAFVRPVEPGRHVSPAGEDIPLNSLVLTSDTVIGSLQLAVAATLGQGELFVFRRPYVAILCTGSELVEPPAIPDFGQTVNVNGPALVSMVKEAGAIPVYLGTAPDDPMVIARMLEEAPQCDLVLTTGGASTGTADRIAEAAERLGAQVLFRRLPMKPGSAALGAVFRRRPWLALSGNPAAAIIQFDVLVRPLLARSSGRSDMVLRAVQARLVTPVDKPCPLRRYLRVHLTWKEGALEANPGLAQQSTVMSSLLHAQGYLEVDPGLVVPAGQPVRVWMRPGALPAGSGYGAASIPAARG